MNPIGVKLAREEREVDFSNANLAKTVVTKDPESALKLIEYINDPQVQGRTVKNCIRKLRKSGFPDKTDQHQQQEYVTAVKWLNAALGITESKTRVKAFTALKMWFKNINRPEVAGKIEYIEEKCPEVKDRAGAQDPHNSLQKLHEIKALLDASKFEEALLKAGDVRKPNCRDWVHAELAARSTSESTLRLAAYQTPAEILESVNTEDLFERTKILKKKIISLACMRMPDLAAQIAKRMPVTDQRDHALDIASCITASYDTNAAKDLAKLICIADRKQESDKRLAKVFQAKESRVNPYELPKK